MSVFTNEIVIDNVPLPVDTTGQTIAVTGTVTANAGTGTMLVDGSAHTQPVSGSVSVSNFPATQPVSIASPVAVTQSTSPWVVSGTVTTTSGSASASTITRVATSAVSTTLLAANASRKRLIVTTETGAQNYVALGSAASATNYSYLLTQTATLDLTGWVGTVTLARATGTGNVQVTELV